LYPNPLAAGQKLQVKIPKLDQGAHSLLVNDLIGKSHAVNITSINMGDYELLEVEFDQNLSRGVYWVQYELNGKTETYQLLVE
jgi:methionine-rich copper-binding protein CopC